MEQRIIDFRESAELTKRALTYALNDTESGLDWCWCNEASIHQPHHTGEFRDWNNELARIGGKGQLDSSGGDVFIFKTEKHLQKVRFKICIRPTHNVKNRPNYNLPTSVRSLDDGLAFLKVHNIHFLLITYYGKDLKNPRTFWCDTFSSIPYEDWLEVSRHGYRVDGLMTRHRSFSSKFYPTGKDYQHMIKSLKNLIEQQYS